jgi:capsular exopolysaccharide synthesis family protein
MNQASDLGGYLHVLRRRKWEIALIVLLTLGSVTLFTLRLTPVYAAQATVLVKGIPSPGSGAVLQPPDLPTEQGLILQSSEIVGKVQESLKLTKTPEQILNHLSVTILPDTSLMHIAYSDPSSVMAAKVANAFAGTYVAYHDTQATSQFQDAAVGVQVQIGGIQTAINRLQTRVQASKDPATRARLQNRLGGVYAQLGVLNQRLLDLTSTEGIAQTSALVVQRAPVPTHPASPSFPKNIAAGLAGGLMLAVAVALLRERLDDRLTAPDELEEILGAPILAMVPRVKEWGKSDDPLLVTQVNPRSPASEAYRTLATNVLHLASQKPLAVVMVTSAVPGEGKTVTSCNLGVALAQAGKRVILVSADLRNPRLHRFFDLENDVGISDLEFGSEIREPTVDAGMSNLLVVKAGPNPTNPVVLLGSPAFRNLITSLRDVSDFVIIDTPPVLAVADALVVAPLAVGTIVVANESVSGASALGRARDQLETAGARIVGGVYNNFDPRGDTAYSYYSRSYYGDSKRLERIASGLKGSPNSRRRKQDLIPEATAERSDEQV